MERTSILTIAIFWIGLSATVGCGNLSADYNDSTHKTNTQEPSQSAAAKIDLALASEENSGENGEECLHINIGESEGSEIDCPGTTSGYEQPSTPNSLPFARGSGAEIDVPNLIGD